MRLGWTSWVWRRGAEVALTEEIEARYAGGDGAWWRAEQDGWAVTASEAVTPEGLAVLVGVQ